MQKFLNELKHQSQKHDISCKVQFFKNTCKVEMATLDNVPSQSICKKILEDAFLRFPFPGTIQVTCGVWNCEKTSWEFAIEPPGIELTVPPKVRWVRLPFDVL